ncbi:FAD-dependent oxidoreductase [Ruminococcaceae bacterium OttesenSCG-928-L11]|nr:FAD-dependent oxidoreductase [Ruminococcaceae bacterium OttesenSCG-928-L11]
MNGQTGKRIVIVGGVAGGASAAARLRRLDETASIVLLERGEYISFANCGLPYYIGGEITGKSALTLQTPESFRARFEVDVRVCNEAVAIDREAREVEVCDRRTGQTYREPYDALILSTGAAPLVPPIPGVDSERVFTLRNIPDTYRIREFMERERPRSAVVVGGGYIGVEMAENLTRAGLAVTIVEAQEQVIAPLDYDMACDVHRHIRDKGVTLLLGAAVSGIENTGDGLRVGVGDRTLEADMLLLSVGVRPESAIAAAAGLAVNERGGVRVDARMRTSDPAIYAVGDMAEVEDYVSKTPAMIPLAGPANKQGRIAADNICGIPSSYSGTQGSSVLRVFDRTVAATGLNEKTAKRLQIPYEKSFTYPASHAGYYPGAEPMSVKLLFAPDTGKILGAQIVGGEGVDKRCDVIATAIRFGGTAADLEELELCYAPPYSSAKDPVNMAGFAAGNVLSGRVSLFHWHDVEAVLQREDAVLLDVRTEGEYRRGHIEGSVNIPLDSLRERLAEVDAGKEIHVLCQVGLRGYLACCILNGRGYRCRNLSGGYRLYASVMEDKASQGPCC